MCRICSKEDEGREALNTNEQLSLTNTSSAVAFGMIGPYSMQSLPFGEKNSGNNSHPMMTVQGTRLDESTGYSALSGMRSCLVSHVAMKDG